MEICLENGGERALPRGYGLKVTLSTPESTYPTNALVEATVTVVNISKKPIDVLEGLCKPVLGIDVLDTKGKPYPSPVAFSTDSCPPEYLPDELNPGKSLHDSPFVILQSGLIRSNLAIAGGKTGTIDVIGKTLKLAVVSGQPEHVTLAPAPANPNGGYTASITPVQAHRGHLYVTSYQFCNKSNGEDEGEGDSWDQESGATVSTDILGSFCSSEKWQFVAGWIGLPVATFLMTVSTN